MLDSADSARRRVLIVDEDAVLSGTIADALENEGFQTARSGDGRDAVRLVEDFRPHVLLLDIWVSGLNGIEILRSLQGRDSACRVIMFSGHGTIAMAVRAMQLGAFDYVEKPCPLDSVVETVRRACSARDPGDAPPRMASPPRGNHRRTNGRSALRRPQRTLRRSAVGHGVALQSGVKTGIMLEPMPPGSGIVFRNVVTGETLPASVDFVASTSFCTTLHNEGITVRTVEHLMSALHAYGISNVQIQVGDEVPIMDGSAASFCRLIEQCGVIEQDDGQEEFVVDRCFQVGTPDPSAKFILVEPYDGFKVSYRLQYPQPLGVQEYTYEHRSGAGFHLEIAPARTFAFVHEVEKMHDMDMIAGGRLNNVILLGDEKIVNNVQLRFANECVRHKVLDLIGDLYLLGRQLRGHVRANMTGHTENVALVKMLAEAA